jgi:nitrate/TMAO reductase-like tetraheme cytochrome c subunit
MRIHVLSPRKHSGFVFFLAALAWGWAGSASARPTPAENEAWKEHRYQEAKECKQCHTAPTQDRLEDGSLDLVLLTEYSIWKTHDKHAQAYAVLKGKRGQQIGRLLDVDVLKESAGCLNCHAMNNLSKANQAQGVGGGLDPEDGVSCGGCHGPSSKWIGPHADKTWRKKTAEEKFKEGLRDLRDPQVRAALCTSCHVGNAAQGKVVTHAMFAAGHPPLPPLEIATFSRNEPQHWRDAKDVPLFKKPTAQDVKNYHLEALDFQRTKFALVGSLVALRETMQLARDRADLNARDPATVWPELLVGLSAEQAKDAAGLRGLAEKRWPEIALAHSDCFACHHDLKYPGFRQERGFGYALTGRDKVRTIPGRPLVRAWPLGMIELDAQFAGKPAALDALDVRLKALARASNARPFGQPQEIGKATAALVSWCDEVLADLRSAPCTRDSALRMLHGLCKLYDATGSGKEPLIPDYETARQLGAVLKVVYEEVQPRDAHDVQIQAILKELTATLNLEPYVRRKERVAVVLAMIREVTGRNEVRGVPDFASYLENVSDSAALKKLIGNEFLIVLQTTLSNKGFTEGLLKHADQLQKLSDEEEVLTLRAVADYDPAAFLARLRRLDKELPPQP